MYQKIVEHILNPLLALYHGSNELSLLTQLRKHERLSSDERNSVRINWLRDLLKHSQQYVPFYQKRFADAGFDPAKLQDFADLTQLPILTKSEIQSHKEQLISSFYDRSKLIENRTGGSTGEPLVFYLTKDRIDSRQAATLRHNLWAGYRVGMKVALIWGHQSDLSLFSSVKARLRDTLVDRTLICDSSSLDKQKLIEFARRFQSFRPQVILAYANSLSHVVDFLQSNNVELPTPKTIITSAEVLTSENRTKIENYFGTSVFDRYGARETSVIASECEAHDGMHINADHLHLEFVKDNRTCAPGEVGEILVTDLLNYSFPFIRYQIGDLGAPAPSGCTCGRTLPRMQIIAGRTTDFLYAPDGRQVSGAALTIYLASKVTGIRQAQIIQRQRSRLIFKLVVDGSFNDASRAAIKQKVVQFFGDQMEFEIVFVESISKEPSGKYRFSICELEPSEFRK